MLDYITRFKRARRFAPNWRNTSPANPSSSTTEKSS